MDLAHSQSSTYLFRRRFYTQAHFATRIDIRVESASSSVGCEAVDSWRLAGVVCHTPLLDNFRGRATTQGMRTFVELD